MDSDSDFQIIFDFASSKPVVLEPSAGQISSDAGLLPVITSYSIHYTKLYDVESIAREATVGADRGMATAQIDDAVRFDGLQVRIQAETRDHQQFASTILGREPIAFVGARVAACLESRKAVLGPFVSYNFV